MKFHRVSLALFWLAVASEERSSPSVMAFMNHSTRSVIRPLTIKTRKEHNSFCFPPSGVAVSSRRYMSIAPDDLSPRRVAPDDYADAYAQWCIQYGKRFEESRLPIFKENSIQMQAYTRKTGQRMEPNEYSDLTTKEYDDAMRRKNKSHHSHNSSSSSRQKRKPNSNSFSSKVSPTISYGLDADERQASAYKEWCKANGKPISDSSHEEFRAMQHQLQQQQRRNYNSNGQTSFANSFDPWRRKQKEASDRYARMSDEEALLNAEQDFHNFDRQARMEAEYDQLRVAEQRRQQQGRGREGSRMGINDPDQQTRVNRNDAIHSYGSDHLPRQNRLNFNGDEYDDPSAAAGQQDFNNYKEYININEDLQRRSDLNRNEDNDRRNRLDITDHFQQQSLGGTDDFQLQQQQQHETADRSAGPNFRDDRTMIKRDFSRPKVDQLDQDPSQRARVNLNDAVHNFGRQWQPKAKTRRDERLNGDLSRQDYNNYNSFGNDKRSQQQSQHLQRDDRNDLPNNFQNLGKEKLQESSRMQGAPGGVGPNSRGREDRNSEILKRRNRIDQSNRFNMDDQMHNYAGGAGHKEEEETSSARPASSYNPRMNARGRIPDEQEAERIEIERVRDAYGNWCSKYGRRFDESRVNNFAANFYKMEEYQKATGRTIDLNEHSDLTSAEFQIMQEEEGSRREEERLLEAEEQARALRIENERLRKSRAEKETAAEREARQNFEESARRKQMRMEQSLFDLNAVYAEFDKRQGSGTGGDAAYSTNKMKKVRHAYHEWCEFYDKEYDESRLSVFASNAKKVAKYYENTGVSMKLNGYADRTADEYREIKKAREMAMGINDFSEDSILKKKVSKPVSFSDADHHSRDGRRELKRIRDAYTEWCITHDKDFDEVRFVNFANNLRQMEKFQKSTGKKVELNEYSDLTAEEYKEVMESGGYSRPSPISTSSEQRVSYRPPPASERDNGHGDSGLVKLAGLIKEIDSQKKKSPMKPPEVATEETMTRAKTDVDESQNMLIRELISDVTDENEDMAQDFATGENKNDLVMEEPNKRGVSIGRGIDSFKDQFPKHVVDAYKEFCQKHGKQFDKDRIANFQYNFIQAEHYFEENGTRIELNEYADLSQEEFTEMKKGAPQEFNEAKTRIETETRSSSQSSPAAAVEAPIEKPKAPIKKPKIVFHEEPIEEATTFPSPAELYRLKMEEEKRKEQEEEEKMLRQAEEEYLRSQRGEDSNKDAAAQSEREALMRKAKQEEEERLKAEEVTRAKAAEEEARLKAEKEARIKAEADAKLREAAKRKAEMEARARHGAEEAARLKDEELSRKAATAEEARLKARRMKADDEGNHLFEEEARRREAEAARMEAFEKRQKEMKDARLKAEIQAKIKADEEERRRYEEKKLKEAAAEAERMAAEASRLLSTSTAYPPAENPSFEVIEQGPKFRSISSVSTETKSENKLLKKLSNFLGGKDAGGEELERDIAEQADELLAEAKKVNEREEEKIRQMKAETEEWKKIQKSLELEAAARDREHKRTSKNGKVSSSRPVDILESFKKSTQDTIETEEVRRRGKGGKVIDNDSNVEAVFDGFMYVLGGNDEETIGKTNVGKSVIESTDNEKIALPTEIHSKVNNKKNGKEVITPENVPVLSRWRQNPDNRSITGFVRNSPDYTNGTEITISVSKSGAKTGTVVTSLSGVQYKLT